jgi:hypothetical protein
MSTSGQIVLCAYNPEHRERFRTKLLWKEWRHLYPDLFDEDDERIAETQARRGYHFYE